MAATSAQPPLWKILPPLVLGGAGFSYQCHPDPAALPISQIIRRAFDHGIRAIDTSPYYEPSEQLLGESLSQPEVTNNYSRSDYILMTKVGRIEAAKLRTSYLDVVFCHDVEHVTDGDVIGAVGELFEFVRQGKVRYIGISSYRIDLLAQLAQAVREQCGKPVDVIQNWGQLTLQNSKLESEGLKLFKDAGVSCVCNSSPLAIGLLRQGGVPVGRLGDFHPAPEGLRKVSQDIADYVASQGESLAALALRFSLWRAQMTSHESFRMCTITGISTIPELTENIKTAGKILTSESGNAGDLVNSLLDEEQVKKDQALFDRAHDMFGDWIDYGFTVPEKGWSRELKRVVS